jgi:hypothetical protein
MLKKIFLILLGVILAGYLFFALFYLNPKVGNDLVCQKVEVYIVDSLENRYLSEKDILQALKQNNLNPVDKKISQIKTDDIKKHLEGNRLIKKVDCYKTIDGAIMIKVYQRIPILRVFSSVKSFYIDNEGEIIPALGNISAYVPVASGNIDEEFAKKKLYEFASFLEEDKFWNSQIEQIYIAPNQDVELIPRVGNHQIILGNIDDYKENLDKLKLFYEKGLNKIGWNRYSVINVKYKNQVVCTKTVGAN